LTKVGQAAERQGDRPRPAARHRPHPYALAEDEILLRGDSYYCGPQVLDLLERLGCNYILGLSAPRRLDVEPSDFVKTILSLPFQPVSVCSRTAVICAKPVSLSNGYSSSVPESRSTASA
jgi:hypothetical protein